MKTQLTKTTVRGASVALLVSAGVLLFVAGTQATTRDAASSETHWSGEN